MTGEIRDGVSLSIAPFGFLPENPEGVNVNSQG